MIQQAAFVTASIVFAVGLYGIVTHRDMIKICISLSVMESAVVMLFVTLAYRPGATAPILDEAAVAYVDPVLHALSLTAIVIGAGVLSVALALTVIVYRRHGTTDIRVVFRRDR